MANNTSGFNYENADTDRFQDKKIKRLVKHFGGIGYSVWDFIKNEIYRVKGYYIEWDEDTAFDVADYWGIKELLVDEIVKYCCHVGLFNKELLASGGILTSAAIQVRFLKWSKFMKRKEAKILEKYYIIPEELPKIREESEGKEKKEETKLKGNDREDFSPPQFDEVLVFFKEKSSWPEKKCLAEAKKFIDHYSQTGWKIKNGQITKWENTASGWITRDLEFGHGKNTETYHGPGKLSDGRDIPDIPNDNLYRSLSLVDKKKVNTVWCQGGFRFKSDGKTSEQGWYDPEGVKIYA